MLSASVFIQTEGGAEGIEPLTPCMPLTSQPFTPHRFTTRSHTSVLLSKRMASRRHGAECGIVRHGCWRIAGRSGAGTRQCRRPGASAGSTRTRGALFSLDEFRVERRANDEASSVMASASGC